MTTEVEGEVGVEGRGQGQVGSVRDVEDEGSDEFNEDRQAEKIQGEEDKESNEDVGYDENCDDGGMSKDETDENNDHDGAEWGGDNEVNGGSRDDVVHD